MLSNFLDNKIDIKFHHLGLAVKKPEIVRKFLVSLGYKPQKELINKIFNVYIQFHEHEFMPKIELIYKYKDSTPIDKILQYDDAQIYHICYKCTDIKKVILGLKNIGLKAVCISRGTKDFPFSFYYIKGIGLIELLEDNNKVNQ